MLKDMNLEPCRGCYVCVLKGEDKCPLKDDRDMTLQEIAEADGVVFATPVYVNHISGLMKHFFDRLGYIAHRPQYYDKYAMVMAICAGFGAKEANDYMEGVLSVFGFNVVSSLELKVMTKTEREREHNLDLTKKALNTLISGILEGRKSKPSPTLTQAIYFNIFKYISELNKEQGKADYEFYRDKTEFACDAKIGFFKKFLAKRIAKKFMKKMEKELEYR